MLDLSKRLSQMQDELNEVQEWADSEYDKYFAKYFKGEQELYTRMKYNSDLSDQELEWILTDLPLELFSVTEQLSKLKIAQEVIKIAVKQKEKDLIESMSEGSMTQKKETAIFLTMEDRLLIDVYDSIMDRVNKQMSFSKELIMSAKKIWDSRKADGILMPEVVVEPKKETLPNRYIRG